jgi:SET domain-containing protein
MSRTTNPGNGAAPRRSRRSRRRFAIRESPIQGRGAFATTRIRPGARIIEYTGERISPAEADRRYDDDRMERHHTYLFTVDDDTVVDAAVGGNDARFINHSCEPNCVAVIERGRIWIEAIRNIQPGRELVYDYQYERSGRYRASWKTLYACHCGAPSCRGTILKPRRRRRGRRRTRST